jgi:predicted lipid-binding transport protein (Tim44 family)
MKAKSLLTVVTLGSPSRRSMPKRHVVSEAAGNLGQAAPAPDRQGRDHHEHGHAADAGGTRLHARREPGRGHRAAGAGAAAAAKPSFMGRWGGLLAGLGIGALLGGLFGAQMGPVIGLILAALLAFGLVFLLYRLFAGKRAEPAPPKVGYAGIGSDVAPAPKFEGIGSRVPEAEPAPQPANSVRRSAIEIPGFEVAPFVRVAKTSFIRLQAANDSGDLDDIRDYTTPEMYAEIAMQLKEREGSQKTEVVSLDADVVEAVIEDGYEIASVRFWGLLRENDARNPEPFEETWHVRRKAGDRKATWLIAGIQQAA